MDWLSRLGTDIQRAYQHEIIDPGKQPQWFLLIAFLATFALVRFITHSIRAGRFKRVFRNVSAGGTHLHHLVPGIILMLVCGYLAIALPPGFAREPVAIGFGIGMALTLDEFALWLHLEDVYWAKEGRQSVDAVIIVATILVLILTGAS
ncbi:MAG: hypothetical protein H0U67_05480, partial [Gemmatimonadetes bacterium]|nr:hypothetical protein [Gemmatimonadota bacterium]